MTAESFEIEREGDLSLKFLQKTCGATANRHPRIKEIISGTILLAASDRDPIPLPEVHSIIEAMKSHESIFSGIHFSLTGAVCFSREIDQAIKHLTDGGFLKIVGESALMGEHAPEFVEYLSRRLTNSQIQAVHSVSLRFHDRLRRNGKDPRDSS